jgi:hypothetical protein
MTDFTKLQHSSLTNYQEFDINSSDTINGSRSISHTEGGIPYVRVWAEQISGEVSALVIPSVSTLYHDDYATAPTVDTLGITSAELNISAPSGALLVYWRIYVDLAR